MSESPPPTKRLSEQDAWIYGGVGAAAFSTVLGVGLFGFYEDRQVLGTIFTAIGACGLVAMIILLKGNRLTILHSAMAFLIVTWLFFGYMLWEGPHTVVRHEPATAEEISKFASPLISERDALRQQAASAQNRLDEAMKEAPSLKAKLEEENRQIASLQSQLAVTSKERDTEKQRADNATKGLAAVNERLSALQNQSITASAPTPTSILTFSQTYSLTDPQIKALRDEVFKVKGSLPPAINIELVSGDPKANQLANQIHKALDLAGTSPSNLIYGHPTSPKDVGVLIRVGDLRSIPEGAKVLASAIKEVIGTDPTFIDAPQNLGPGGFTLLVGPSPDD